MKQKTFFDVVRLSREDISELGLKTKALTDERMETIAKEVSERIMPEFWDVLENTLSDLNYVETK